MTPIRNLLLEQLNEKTLRATVSSPRKSGMAQKIVIRPFMEKNRLMFQQEEYRNNQVFHTNLDKETAVEHICSLVGHDYRQLDIQCEQGSYRILVSKKGKINIKEQKNTSVKKIDLAHNRKKQYILDGSEKIPFLMDLGVQTKDGKIVDKKQKKLRQINRFLEFVRDVLPVLKKNAQNGRPLRIIDFGCGKSYLTFAVYYYLKIRNGIDVQMTGLDLKTDVIRHCNELAEKYGYTELRFSEGDIRSYEGAEKVDMVITLHACDIATDYALEKAVKWGANVILSVPCCQHEIANQIDSELLSPLLKYGILKERFSALLTDALRASLLEQNGYDVQILEFIDMEHTPKNLLIRAVRNQEKREGNTEKRELERQRYETLCDAVNSYGTLERLLDTM